jgi:single-strand DNA-binding protein
MGADGEEALMAGETVITVVGNLTADPELRYTQNGLAVANFTIASTPRTYDKQANEWKDGDALFLRASVWREFAEHVAGSLTKGARVIAQGRLVQKSYQDREGNQRTGFQLEVDEIGPSLRYATAQVTRSSGGGRGGSSSGGGQANGGWAGQGQGGAWNGAQGGGQHPDQPWRPDQGQQGGGQVNDVWSEPGGTYDDSETPF